MTVAYDGGDGSTRRIVPGGAAEGQYNRHGWTADFSLDYVLPIAANWLVRPRLGATAIRVSHDRVAETGSTAFALDVAR